MMETFFVLHTIVSGHCFHEICLGQCYSIVKEFVRDVFVFTVSCQL